jgi:hypothetical protein
MILRVVPLPFTSGLLTPEKEGQIDLLTVFGVLLSMVFTLRGTARQACSGSLGASERYTRRSIIIVVFGQIH